MKQIFSLFSSRVTQAIAGERKFLALVTVFLLIAIVLIDYPSIVMWVGFGLAGYSVIANDSIQTIGTFLVSNQKRPWWLLWLYIGGIFLATITYSYIQYGGDVSYGRLASKGFDVAPESFHILQILAPLVLMILTRLRIPVSTTFLILTAFAGSF